MSQPSAPGACKWMEEPVMPMVDGLFASGLINSTTRVKLKEIEPNLKDEYQNHNLKGAKKTSLAEKPATSSSQRSGASRKSSNRVDGQESRYQKRKLLHLDHSSKTAHSKAASPSLNEPTSKYLSFAIPPPNFSIQNNENMNVDQYMPDSNNISIGIPIDELLLTKKRIIGKREIQRLLSDYIKKMNNYNTTIAESQMCKDENDVLKDPSFEFKELDRMLNITFATWNTAITTIRGYSDEYARLLYEIKKFFQKRVEKFPEIIEKYNEKIANLNSANDLQKETIEQIKATVIEKENEIEICKKTIEELNLKIFHLEHDKEQLNTRINDAEYSKEHIEEEYNTAVFRLTRSEEERKKSSQVLQSTQELLESCRSQIAHQEEVIEKYEEEGAGFRPLYTRAAFENQQYIKDLNDLKEKMKNMVVKQKTVNVEVQANLIKVVNEQKPKKVTTTTRPTKKSTKKLQKQKSSVVVRNMMEKFDPAVLNSTAATTPDKKKKKKKPSSASKQVKHSTISSPSNAKLNENAPNENNNNNKIEDISAPTSVNVSTVASPCLKELMMRNQGILKSSEKFNQEINQCISFDSVSDVFDPNCETQNASNIGRNQSITNFSREQSNANFSREQSRVSFTREQSNVNFSREQSHVNFTHDKSNASFTREPSNINFTQDQSRVSFAHSPSNVSFSLDQSNNSFTRDSSASKSVKRSSSKKTDESQLKSKSHSHLLNKGSGHQSKCKSANFSPTLSPIVSQDHSQIEVSELSSSASPDQCLFISPIKITCESPTSLNVSTLPPDYNIRQSFDIDPDTLVSCVYRLLPLPLGTSSIFAHQADPQIENIMNNTNGNMGAKLSESSIVPKYKSYNWMIQRIVEFFHSVHNLDQISNPYIDSVSMLRETIAENTKIEALSDRILQDLIKTAMVHKKSPIVSVFLKVVTYEITASEYKFLNMLFNLAFDFIYPSVQSLLQDPDLSPTSPASQFLINRTICEEIATSIFKHVEKDALEAVRSIEPDSKWPDLVDFWDFALKMISFFTQTHKQFQRQIRAILTLVRLNSQTNDKESINNDNAIITKQNFHDFMIFIRPLIQNKEMEKIYKRFYLECRHRHSNDSPAKRRKILAREFEEDEADISSNTQYNLIRFCTDFPEITEDILVLKCKEDFSYIYGSLTMPLQTLLQFILKRFTDYTKFTQPRLLNPLLDMTRPVLFQMRNAFLRCDVSMAFSCYRHVLQLIDLKCSEACPFTIFDKSIQIEAVHEVTSLIIAREKIVASHIFENRVDNKNKKNEKENNDEVQNKQNCEDNQVDSEIKVTENKENAKNDEQNDENDPMKEEIEKDKCENENKNQQTKENDQAEDTSRSQNENQSEKSDKIVVDNQNNDQSKKQVDNKEAPKADKKSKIDKNSPNNNSNSPNISNNDVSSKENNKSAENDQSKDKCGKKNDDAIKTEKVQKQNISQDNEKAKSQNNELSLNGKENQQNDEKSKANCNDKDQNKEKIEDKENSNNKENTNNQNKELNEDKENAQSKEKNPTDRNIQDKAKSAPNKENSQTKDSNIKENNETEQKEIENQDKENNNLHSIALNNAKIETKAQSNNETRTAKPSQVKVKTQCKENIQNDEKSQVKSSPNKENTQTKENASNKTVNQTKEKVQNNEKNKAKTANSHNKESANNENKNQSCKNIQQKEFSREKEESQANEVNQNANKVDENNPKNKIAEKDKKANQSNSNESNKEKDQTKANPKDELNEKNKPFNNSNENIQNKEILQVKNENMINEAIEQNDKTHNIEMNANENQDQNQKINQDKNGREEPNDIKISQAQKQCQSKENTQSQKVIHNKETKEEVINNQSQETSQDKSKINENEGSHIQANETSISKLNSNSNESCKNEAKEVCPINKNIQIKQEQLKLNSNDSNQAKADIKSKIIYAEDEKANNCKESKEENKIILDKANEENKKIENSQADVNESQKDKSCINGNQSSDCNTDIKNGSDAIAKNNRNNLSKIMKKFKSNQIKKFVKLSPASKASPNSDKNGVINKSNNENQLNDDKKDNENDILSTDTEPQQRAE